MGDGDRDEVARQGELPPLPGLLRLKDWLTLQEAASWLAQTLGTDVSDTDILRLGLDRRLVLSVRLVNPTDALPGRLIARHQETAAASSPTPMGAAPRRYRLENGVDIELEGAIVSLLGVYDLPMIGGETAAVESEYQRRVVDPLQAPVHVAHQSEVGLFLRQGDILYQLQGWLVGDGFKIVPARDARPPTRRPYPVQHMPDHATIVVRPEALRQVLAVLHEHDDSLHFEVPARLVAVPDELAGLPPDTWVRFTEAPQDGRSGSGACRAGALVARMRAIIAQQAEGWFTLDEAAQQLQGAGRGSAKDWAKKLSGAARSGALPMHEPGSLARVDYGATSPNDGGRRTSDGPGPGRGARRPVRPFYEWVHAEDLNRWISQHEPRLLFRFDEPQAANAGLAQAPEAIPAPNRPPAPVPRARAQEEAILAKLRELNFDPLAVPAAPPGKESSAKQRVRAALGYSPSVMRKAWQRLRDDGRIRDA